MCVRGGDGGVGDGFGLGVNFIGRLSTSINSVYIDEIGFNSLFLEN